jgi:hypothetical protein
MKGFLYLNKKTELIKFIEVGAEHIMLNERNQVVVSTSDVLILFDWVDHQYELKKCVDVYEDHKVFIYQMYWNEEFKEFYVNNGSANNELMCFDIELRMKLKSPYFRGIKGDVTSIEWSTDNHHAIMCLKDLEDKGEVIIYNMREEAIQGIIPIESPMRAFIVDQPKVTKYIQIQTKENLMIYSFLEHQLIQLVTLPKDVQ